MKLVQIFIRRNKTMVAVISLMAVLFVVFAFVDGNPWYLLSIPGAVVALLVILAFDVSAAAKENRPYN